MVRPKQQKIDRFIENYPDQVTMSLRGYFKKYAGREVVKERIIEVFTEQIETACNTIDGLLEQQARIEAEAAEEID